MVLKKNQYLPIINKVNRINKIFIKKKLNLKTELLLIVLLFGTLLLTTSCESDRKYEEANSQLPGDTPKSINKNKKNHKSKQKQERVIEKKLLEKILKNNLGTYFLEKIDGQAGENAEYKTFKDKKGFWYATGSSLTGGSFGEDYKLNKKEQYVLNSVTLDIDSNLAIRFFISKNKIFSTKYQSEKFSYHIDSSLSEIINPLDNNTKFNDTLLKIQDQVLVYLTDNINFDKLLPNDCGFSELEHFALLSFNTNSREFYITAFDPNDRARFHFIFKKHNSFTD